MRIQNEAGKALSLGFAAISRQFSLPSCFPDAVLQAAESTTKSNDWVYSNTERKDAREIPYITLDPATSTDLDQAFHLTEDGDDIVLSYALADISDFVPFDSPIEQESWKRGVTVYGMPTKFHFIPIRFHNAPRAYYRTVLDQPYRSQCRSHPMAHCD